MPGFFHNFEVTPHELPPGHGYSCAYVGEKVHNKMLVRVSLDQIHGSPQVVIQIFPQFSDPNPERKPDSPRRFIQSAHTHHQVIIPLDRPRMTVAESFNRATFSTTKRLHDEGLKAAEKFGLELRKKEAIQELLLGVSLKEGATLGDEFDIIRRNGNMLVRRWQVQRA